MVEKTKVGFFGGSFDPIHFGHLKLAKNLARIEGLQEVWFCPARLNPHKQNCPPASLEDRMEMIRLAIEDEPSFSLLSIEAEREGPSYTIDTLRELVKKENASLSPKQIYLILSDEALEGFFQWKEPEEIIRLVPLLIGSRFNSSFVPKKYEGNPLIYDAIKNGWRSTERFNISSTEIRQNLFKGQNCREFVPKKVLDYISQNKLYC